MKPFTCLGAAGAIWIPVTAFAQTVPTTLLTLAAPATFDYTALAVSVIGGLLTVVGTVGVALINSRMKDKQAAQTLDNALTNSLGAVKNAIDAEVKTHPLQATIPGISAPLAAGVQYALGHAGNEVARFGITPEALADKIAARMGRQTVVAAVAVPKV